MTASLCPPLAQDLSGKLFGDKGYISKRLFQTLFLTLFLSVSYERVRKAGYNVAQWV